MAYGHTIQARFNNSRCRAKMLTCIDRRCNTPFVLSTANDLVNGDKTVPQQIGELGEVAEPYVLDSSPDVLSIGRRRVQQGYAFSGEC